MSQFSCELNVLSLPERVRPGQSVRIEADVTGNNATVGFVMLSVPEAGETLRFAKKSENSYTLGYRVPDFAPAGLYRVGVYVVGDNGTRTEPQWFTVTVE